MSDSNFSPKEEEENWLNVFDLVVPKGIRKNVVHCLLD